METAERAGVGAEEVGRVVPVAAGLGAVLPFMAGSLGAAFEPFIDGGLRVLEIGVAVLGAALGAIGLDPHQGRGHTAGGTPLAEVIGHLGAGGEIGPVTEGTLLPDFMELVVRQFAVMALEPAALQSEGSESEGVQTILIAGQGVQSGHGRPRPLLRGGAGVQRRDEDDGRRERQVGGQRKAGEVVRHGLPVGPGLRPGLGIDPLQVGWRDGVEMLAGVLAHGHEIVRHEDTLVTGAEVGDFGGGRELGGIGRRETPEAFAVALFVGGGPGGHEGLKLQV